MGSEHQPQNQTAKQRCEHADIEITDGHFILTCYEFLTNMTPWSVYNGGYNEPIFFDEAFAISLFTGSRSRALSRCKYSDSEEVGDGNG